MISLISFILAIIGCINWLSIGILQFDFVAGIFGSQSNIFSRIVYTLVGIAAVIVTFNLLKNKGKFVISFKKKEDEEYENYANHSSRKMAMSKTESSKDNSLNTTSHNSSTSSYQKNKDDK